MGARLVTVYPPPGGVYRLARRPAEPFAPPEWEHALEDGTFGNRFDDPSAEDGRPEAERFRAIYCATQRTATFGETVARFRPSLSLLRQLESIDDDQTVVDALAGAVDPDDPHRGVIPADWRLRRHVGHTLLRPSLRFVDIADIETVQHLRRALAPLADELHLQDVDLSVVTSQHRRFTQECARYIYDQADSSGRPLYAGVRYLSRLNSEWECWAIFHDRIQHEQGWPGPPQSLFPDDADLLSVAAVFNLTIEVFSGEEHYIRPEPLPVGAAR